MRALKVSASMYRAVWYLIIFPFVSSPVRATVGVAAGCGFASTWVKVGTFELVSAAIADVSYYVPLSACHHVRKSTPTTCRWTWRSIWRWRPRLPSLTWPTSFTT